MKTRAIVASWALLLSCARSPSPAFYALSSQPGARLTARPLKIELRRPALPSYLDRAEIVRRVTPERLELAADERWAGPLQRMLGTTLAEDLSQRLPGAVVFTEEGAISSSADVTVDVALSRFELTERGEVRMVADVAAHWHGHDAVRFTRHDLSLRPKGPQTPRVVAGLSGLLARLSDAIAQNIAAGSPATDALP